MKQIVGIINPFALNQVFYCLDGEEEVAGFSCNINSLATNLVQFAKNENVDDIVLKKHCPQAYLDKFLEDINKETIKEFSYNKLNVTII